MDIDIIRKNFNKKYECENDIVKQLFLDLIEMQKATKTLGIDLSKSKALNDTYNYLFFKLKDTADERKNIDLYKARFNIKEW